MEKTYLSEQVGADLSKENETELFVGIDSGSIACKVVVMDKEGSIEESIYERTGGRPLKKMYEILKDVFEDYGYRIKGVYGTGSSARKFCEKTGVPFENELIAHGTAVSKIYPLVNTVIEMGGQDSKILFLSDKRSSKGVRNVSDFCMNGSCAAGTGSFLDQQAVRLEVSIEKEFGEMAISSKTPPRVAGRCSVFAKSDMIHLQQQATPVKDIIAGLCLGMARNIKSSLCQGRKLVSPVAFCGGVASNAGMVWALREVFGYDEENLIVPEEHKFTGAMGACLMNISKGDSGENFDGAKLLNDLKELSRQHYEISDRLERLDLPSVSKPKSKVRKELVEGAREKGERIKCYLGVDVGSISTNLVVIDENKNVLSKVYLMTASKPLEAVKKGLRTIFKEIGDVADIAGCCSTGSGRYLTGDFIGADLIINEITAQATGAGLVDGNVDTIFEIGGQDSKFISLEEGVVVDFEMNHACAAGTGSFLEEQAERLDLSIKGEFADEAFKSSSPIHLGERCTVFIESDLIDYQQKDAKREDLVAGLAYSIVHNYLNRVVGTRKIGDNIFFQGGTAFNRAVVAAFEKVTNKRITVPDHHEVTGALGAAELVRRKMISEKSESGFRGFDLSDVEYSIRTFECEHCSCNCEIKEVTVKGRDKLCYGSRCDRYNLKNKKSSSNRKDLFKLRNKLMFEHAGIGNNKVGSDSKKIGIPLCLYNYQMLPLWSRFFQELGFEVVLSGGSDKSVIKNGTQAVLSQTCFPIKVAHGHVMKLWEKDVDHIWLPSIVTMAKEYEENKHSNLCPYVQTICYQVRSALCAQGYAEQEVRDRIIDVPVHMTYGEKDIYKSLICLVDKLGVSRKRIKGALEKGLKAQKDFEDRCIETGREVLAGLGENERACVVVSRPYNGYDAGINLDISKKLMETGLYPIPMDFLPLDEADISEMGLQSRMYWKYGQKILRAAHIIRKEKRLFGVYISNFSCGPDSFIVSFFRELMKDSHVNGGVGQKPTLVLEIDEHSADAGVVTRIEAFNESLKSVRRLSKKTDDSGNAETSSPWREDDGLDLTKKMYLPWMGDRSYAVAAACRNAGNDIHVLPIADKESLKLGRKFTTGKECLPCIITTGDMLAKLKEPDVDPSNTLFFMPGTGGPCRLGQYGCLQKLILKEAGLSEQAEVFVPNQDTNFYREFKKMKKDPSLLSFMGVVAVDTIYKMKLRTRPYAVNKEQVERVYQNNLRRIINEIEGGTNIKQLNRVLIQAAETFASLELKTKGKWPLISLVGEVYVRNHYFANQNIIERLEDLGLEVQAAGLANWLYYTNYTRKLAALREKDYGALIQNGFKNAAQHYIERGLLKGLDKYFCGLEEGNIEELMDIAEPYVDRSFHGETILSVAEMLHGYKEGTSGAVNVGPFTCMPTNIVTSLTNKISSDCESLPILNITYDGQNDPALETRLEAFVYQVRAFKNSNKGGQNEFSRGRDRTGAAYA